LDRARLQTYITVGLDPEKKRSARTCSLGFRILRRGDMTIRPRPTEKINAANVYTNAPASSDRQGDSGTVGAMNPIVAVNIGAFLRV
jgi:hypothetical protein